MDEGLTVPESTHEDPERLSEKVFDCPPSDAEIVAVCEPVIAATVAGKV